MHAVQGDRYNPVTCTIFQINERMERMKEVEGCFTKKKNLIIVRQFPLNRNDKFVLCCSIVFSSCFAAYGTQDVKYVIHEEVKSLWCELPSARELQLSHKSGLILQSNAPKYTAKNTKNT